MRTLFVVILAIAALFCNAALAQELHQEEQGVSRAKVVRVLSDEVKRLPGLDIDTRVQRIEAEILEGPQQGKIVTFDNDFLALEAGDKFFLNYLVTIEGSELYGVQEPDRRGVIFFFIGLFVLTVLVFGGLQGLRSLLALCGSFFIIFYLMLPQVLERSSPVLVSFIFSTLILALAIYLTHGFNRKSTAALLGCILSILITIVLATVAVDMAQLSGFIDEAAMYLNFNTRGQLDFSGLFLAAIIIGVLGILDDIAITQASAVEQLKEADKNLPRWKLYKMAMKIGKEHVGALINTLALAYTGTALPLLLLFYKSESSIFLIINREIFSAEIIRTIVGSIGIILTVPIATFLSVLLLAPRSSSQELKKDSQTNV